MKPYVILLALLALPGCNLSYAQKSHKNLPVPVIKHNTVLAKTSWLHGSVDCGLNTGPAIDIYKHNPQTYIIRQNKCLTFEAPFIYVLVGEDKILVLDTGAIDSDSGFSIYKELVKILGDGQVASKEMLVIHTHGHRDHFQGDSHFSGYKNVTVVQPNKTAVHQFFGLFDWPHGQAKLDLGGRELTIIPTPGHQEEAITLYDQQTKWLLTGDTLYPGFIYIKSWEDYQKSIKRLAEFSAANEVVAILGSHIEMKNKPGEYYPIGSSYQPDEAMLDMSVENLRALNTELTENTRPRQLLFSHFVVQPMGVLQKTLSNVVRWLTQ